MNIDGNNMTGPSRDYHGIYSKEAVWRNEPHSIAPERAAGYSFAMKPRPKTQKKPHYDLVPGRIPVLVRNSNVNPAADGTGDTTSDWSTSTQMLGEADPGYEAPASGLHVKTILAGIALGLLVFRIAQ